MLLSNRKIFVSLNKQTHHFWSDSDWLIALIKLLRGWTDHSNPIDPGQRSKLPAFNLRVIFFFFAKFSISFFLPDYFFIKYDWHIVEKYSYIYMYHMFSKAIFCEFVFCILSILYSSYYSNYSIILSIYTVFLLLEHYFSYVCIIKSPPLSINAIFGNIWKIIKNFEHFKKRLLKNCQLWPNIFRRLK